MKLESNFKNINQQNLATTQTEFDKLNQSLVEIKAKIASLQTQLTPQNYDLNELEKIQQEYLATKENLMPQMQKLHTRITTNHQIQQKLMKKIKLLLVAGACVVLSACSPQAPTVHTTDKGTQWEWNEGTIVVKSPERPAGQKSVIGLTAPKMEVVRVGFVGLGMRGPGAVSRFTHIHGTQIVAICDFDPKRE